MSCGLEIIRESAHPPLTCARNSGGTQHLPPVQVVAGPLHRLDVEIKATLCENVVVILFVAQGGLEACPTLLPRVRVLAHCFRVFIESLPVWNLYGYIGQVGKWIQGVSHLTCSSVVT